ncbi:MAG: DUF362 domain-containing protein [Lentisphaeria bacterium]|nr:DUF362 domain-containing protein [Lentisphaeria bacterium]
MPSNVYFLPVSPGADDAELAAAGRRLLETIADRENISFAPQLPLKVHFGEKGNRTYLKPAVYREIIAFLKEKGIAPCFAETSVLYGGERFTREKHLKLAAAHGFTEIPVVIADGASGEDARDIPLNQHHFQSASIARFLADAPQVLVVSHFKGHMLAGFGGAIKQLSMGFAAKGGKMAMHMNVKPHIRKWFCKGCSLCLKRCQVQAITLQNGKAAINKELCLGCGACFSICPHHAVSVFSFSGFRNMLFGGRIFREKLVEYAFASATGKPHVYLNFAVNITRGCDCEPRPMKNCVPNIGIFASLDPVAIDSACHDAVARAGKTLRGKEQLAYAEKIGLDSTPYTLSSLE